MEDKVDEEGRIVRADKSQHRRQIPKSNKETRRQNSAHLKSRKGGEGRYRWVLEFEVSLGYVIRS